MTLRLLLAVAVVVCAGCGVIRIDVDVYRGPLANHEDVQAQQFAAMSIGVKPLLIQLRDQLLWRDDPAGYCTGVGVYNTSIVLPPNARDDAVIRCRVVVKATCQARPSACWYSEKGFIGALPSEANDQVRQVNNILSLYEDRGVAALAPYVRVLEAGRRTIEQGADTLRVAPDTDDAAWKAVEPGFLRTADARAIRNHFRFSKEVSDTEVAEVAQGIEALRKEFREFLVGKVKEAGRPRVREITGIHEKNEALRALLANVGKKDRGPKTAQQLFAQMPVRDLDPGEVYVYRALSDPARVRLYAQLLFRDPGGPEARAWTARVVALALAAVQSPTAARDIWIATLEALRELGAPGTSSENPQQRDDRTRRIVPALTTVTSSLTQPRNLAIALALPAAQPREEQEARTALKERLVRSSDDATWTPDMAWDQARYDRAARALEFALVSEPAAVSAILLKLDRAYREAGSGAIPTGVKQAYAGPNTRTFGLVRTLAATDTENQESLLDRMARILADLSRVSGLADAHGLERGRIEEGIEHLLEDYLQANDPRSRYALTESERRSRESKAGEARDRLNVALVHFSEKVLLLANNDVLLFRDENNSEDAGLRRHVIVLQAVGNAIQIHGDELAHRASHRSRLDRRAGPELLAIQQAFGRSPREAYEELVRDLQSAAARARVQKTDAEKRYTAAVDAREKLKDLSQPTADEMAAAKELRDAQADFGQKIIPLRRALAAYRLLGDRSTVPLKSLPESGEPNAKVEGDTADLVKAVNAGAAVDGAKLLTEIDKWLKRPENVSPFACAVPGQPPAPLGDRQLRLGCARAYFATPPDALSKLAQRPTAEAVLQDALKIIRDDYDAQVRGLESAATRVTAARTADQKAKDALVTARKLLGDAQKVADAEEAAVRGAEAVVLRLDAAETAVQEYRRAAAEAADDAGSSDDGRPVYAALLSLVKKDMEAASERERSGTEPEKREAKAKRERLQNAYDVLVERRPLAITALTRAARAPRSPVPDRTQRDVLDDVIAVLRYEHLRATAEGGAEGARAKNVSDALRIAADHRAGMAYIRPAGAYLRSSYTATELQDDPRLGWSNLLWEHGKRSIPVVGQLLVSSADEEKRLRVITAIDKQFWQSINRVRLAGAGNTNYAIAKDDIGNWYVKAYSADPAPIIRAAQRLALFNAGANLDINFLQRLDLQQRVATNPDDTAARTELTRLQAEPQPARGGGPGLQRVFDRYRREYAEATARDVTSLRAQVTDGNLPRRIRETWSARISFPNDADGAQKKVFLEDLDKRMGPDVIRFVDTAAKDLAAVEGAPPADERIDASLKRAEGQAAALLAALSNVKRFYGSLLTGVSRISLSNTEAAVGKAQDALRTREDEATRARTEHKQKQDAVAAAERDVVNAPDEQTARRQKETILDQRRKEEEELRLTVKMATEAAEAARKEVERARQAHEAAQRNHAAAMAEVVRSGRAVLLDFAERRRAGVETLERSVIFIGDASRP